MLSFVKVCYECEEVIIRKQLLLSLPKFWVRTDRQKLTNSVYNLKNFYYGAIRYFLLQLIEKYWKVVEEKLAFIQISVSHQTRRQRNEAFIAKKIDQSRNTNQEISFQNGQFFAIEASPKLERDAFPYATLGWVWRPHTAAAAAAAVARGGELPPADLGGAGPGRDGGDHVGDEAEVCHQRGGASQEEEREKRGEVTFQ